MPHTTTATNPDHTSPDDLVHGMRPVKSNGMPQAASCTVCGAFTSDIADVEDYEGCFDLENEGYEPVEGMEHSWEPVERDGDGRMASSYLDNSERRLFRTTLVIWSEYDATHANLSDIARDVEHGESYCVEQVSEQFDVSNLLSDGADHFTEGTRTFFDIDDDTVGDVAVVTSEDGHDSDEIEIEPGLFEWTDDEGVQYRGRRGDYAVLCDHGLWVGASWSAVCEKCDKHA